MSDLELEPARIIVAEDDKIQRMLYTRLLKSSGHLVVASFANRSEAEEGIIELSPTDAHFGIFDGNLTQNDHSGEDGAYLAGLFKSQLPQALAIGVSGDAVGVVGADVNFRKPVDIHELTGYIDQNFPRL